MIAVIVAKSTNGRARLTRTYSKVNVSAALQLFSHSCSYQ